MKKTLTSRLVHWSRLLLPAVLSLTCLAIAITVPIYRSFPVPSKTYLVNLNETGLTLYDRHGQPFFEFDKHGRREVVPLASIPLLVRQAVIAAEDHEFYEHPGFSVRGIVRAAYKNYLSRELEYGGSTITQQLARNVHLNPHKNLYRKLQEIVIAYKIEQHYPKDDILEMYLNVAYFGNGAYGIEAAAQTYFDKSAQELTLAETSYIVGLLPAPSNLSGTTTAAREAGTARQHYVLEQMLAHNYISTAEKQAAEAEPLTFVAPPTENDPALAHFALAVRQELQRNFDEEYLIRGGLHVTTTLERTWQQTSQEQLTQHVATLRRANAHNGAVTVIDTRSGEVLAIVGSVDWNNPQFGKVNMALTPRQTGSAFKPIVYAAGLQTRTLTPTSVLTDRPQTFGKDYRPQNYDGRYRGNVIVRYALANSLNIPAIDAIQKIGTRPVINLAESLGISTFTPEAEHNLSIALGTQEVSLLELTGAYATFANNGLYQQPTTILKIQDKYGRPVDAPARPTRQSISPQTSFLISSMLSDNDTRVQTFGTTLVTEQPSAAKTGTTQDFRDAWTVGYTPNLAIGVWVGNNDNSRMYNLPGATGAAPLWRTLMNRFASTYPSVAFTPPTGLTTRQVCRNNGLLVGNATQFGYTEYFLPGTEPTRYCVRRLPTPPPPTSEPPATPPPPEQYVSQNNQPDPGDQS